MHNPHVLRGMEAVGFRPYTEPWSFASSVSNNNHARYAVDGSTSTRWESAWSDSQFFTTDFITPKRVNTVTLLWETAHAKQYKIQYSNDAAFWTDALVVTDGNGGQDVVSFPEVTARYFRVLGVERGGVDGTVWGYSLYEASFDDVSLPKTPGTPTLLAMSATSLSWKWVDNATDETEYRVLRSTDDTVLKAGLLPNTESWTQSGLAVNTPQSVRVAAVNPFGTTASEASAIVYTRSAIPANTALTTSSNGTYVLTWTANGNPKGTRYKAYRSTDNKTYTQVYSGTQLHTQVHLVRGVRNYFAVRSLNGNGLASAFGVKVTTIAPKRADFPSETIPDVPFSASLSGAHEPESVIFLDPVEETLPPTPTSWKTTGTPWKISSDEENTLLEITPVGPRTRLARYAEDTQQWDLLPLGSPTPPGVYLSVSLAVENVDGARIGPNPFRPAKGDTEVVLRQLIAGSQVKLISTTGEILWEGLADDTGTLTWDGTNTAGRRVASGVYFVLITKDGDKKTFRLAVEQ